jgi:hypothetical protein
MDEIRPETGIFKGEIYSLSWATPLKIRNIPGEREVGTEQFEMLIAFVEKKIKK